jgi:hypothetical protein
MVKKKEISKVGKNKKYEILLLSVLVLVFSSAIIALYQSSKSEISKQKNETNKQEQINYKYGVSYTDSKYGVKIEFPEGIKTYEYKEYKWPSHEHVYNPIFEKTFASGKNQFNFETGNFYLSNDNPQTLGDLISYQVYDIKNCNDTQFCQKYVYSKESSGIIKNGYEPYTFWMRNKNYVIMFGILNADIKSAESTYKLSVQ